MGAAENRASRDAAVLGEGMSIERAQSTVPAFTYSPKRASD
jgi:hypothetical protein